MTKFKVGEIVVFTHPYAFRSREPCKIINIEPDRTHDNRMCYFVQFEDNFVDWLPVIGADEYGMKRVSDILIGEERDA